MIEIYIYSSFTYAVYFPQENENTSKVRREIPKCQI